MAMKAGAFATQGEASEYSTRSAQYGAKGASSAKRTRDKAVQFCYGCSFLSMKSVWTALRVQFDPGFGVGIGGASRLVALMLKP